MVSERGRRQCRPGLESFFPGFRVNFFPMAVESSVVFALTLLSQVDTSCTPETMLTRCGPAHRVCVRGDCVECASDEGEGVADAFWISRIWVEWQSGGHEECQLVPEQAGFRCVLLHTRTECRHQSIWCLSCFSQALPPLSVGDGHGRSVRNVKVQGHWHSFTRARARKPPIRTRTSDAQRSNFTDKIIVQAMPPLGLPQLAWS